MSRYTTVEEQVEYGLDDIAPARTVEVSLRDLLYVYQVLGEFVRFFHQPDHVPDVEAVHEFLGNRKAGGYHLLSECYYDKLYKVWPQDIRDKFDNSEFDHPNPPYYYRPREER